MKWFHRKAFFTALLTVALSAGVLAVAVEYRSGNGFHPFQTNRELQSNQVLFPDNEGQNQLGTDTGDTESFWEQDKDEADSSTSGSNAGYLFNQDGQPIPGTPSGTVVRDGTDSSDTQDGAPGGDIYEITDDGSRGDLILPGGSTLPGEESGSTDGESDSSGKTDRPGGEISGGGGTGGSDNSGTDADPGNGGNGSNTGEVVEPTVPTDPVPTPGYGDASEDPDDSKVTPSDPWGGFNQVYDEDALPDVDDLYNYLTPIISQDTTYGTAQLYRGQTNVSQSSIFTLLQTYAMDWDWNQYVWGSDALGRYIRIDAVAFDDGEKIYDFPVEIPADAQVMKIYVSYRYHLTDEWRPYETYDTNFDPIDYASYALAQGRVLVLNQVLQSEGQKITSDMIMNANSTQYPGATDSSLLNLLSHQQALFGGTGTRLSALFPGWIENGQLVPFLYPITAGRHVLEPAPRVVLNEDYQVEMTHFWVSDDYTVSDTVPFGGVSNYVYLQTLTNYLGDVTQDRYGDDFIDHLTVPRYVQAVQFEYYPGLSVNTLELPSTAFYVNTDGIPGYEDNWLLYGRGLKVKQSYTVADGNPRYTAVDGILYNLDQTELLGLPTERTSLVVGPEITSVHLPYQNRLTELELTCTDIAQLPEINYERLRRSCRIIVPDELLSDFVAAESDTLRQTGLTVYPASQRDQGYMLRGDYLLDQTGVLQAIQRDNVHWISLPDSVTGLSTAAMESLRDELSVLILPVNGQAVTFETGCFDSYDKLTIACYSDTQEAAAQALADAAPDRIRVRRVTVRDDGYSYLETDYMKTEFEDTDALPEDTAGSILLLSVPSGITEFDGTIPMGAGQEALPVTVIGDGVFEDSIALQWVILPETTKAIGYEAFKNCSNLEGVFFASRDAFLLGNSAFDNCATLRFVASNAEKMILEDTDFSLPSASYHYTRYNFLLAPLENEGYDGNYWSSVEDVVSYRLIDCAGTYVLYGVDESGTAWIALRSGRSVTEDLVLPETTEVIFYDAFEGARAANGEFFNLNWEDLDRLGSIWAEGFSGSDLGDDVVFPEDMDLKFKAFADCKKLVRVTMPGTTPMDGVILGTDVFSGCTNLRECSIGNMHYNEGIDATTFTNCPSLETITFLDPQPPKLFPFDNGIIFYFEFDQELSGNLSIVVPDGCEEDYIRAWRYALVGYVPFGNKTAYQSMRDTIENQLWYMLWNSGENRNPTDEEIQSAMDELLLESENRLRTLMDLPETDQISYAYQYVTKKGVVTLMSAKNIGEYTDLSAAELELPDDQILHYVAADAFKDSPELRTVSVPETLVGFHANAFRGLNLRENDETDGLLLLIENGCFDLVLEQEGTPYTFGVPDERVGIVSLPLLNEEVDVSYYIQKWTLAMAGYSSIDAMRAAIAKEIPDDEDAAQARLEELLLKAENRVRTVLQYVDPTDELTFVYDNAPAASAAPTVDALPAEPVLPPDADVPEEPEEPETPADPDEPESPEEPEEPDEQPDTPDEPTVPEENTAVILPALNEDRPVFVGPEDEEETEK